MTDLRLLDGMLFNYGTTNRTDFRNGEIDPNPYKTVYKKKPTCLRIRPPPLKNIHTLTEWKHPNIPTEMMVKPKEIVRTNPRHVQQKYEKPIDHGREEVQNTRPRLVMTPAVSLDDIEDPSARNIIISDMYTTDNTYNFKMPVSSSTRSITKAPLSDLPAPSNPIVLPKLTPPYVSPEWRMESVSWDLRQLRGYCAATERFWLQQKLPKCKMCEETAVVHAHRKMLRDLETKQNLSSV